jgi:replicative DNA helicase
MQAGEGDKSKGNREQEISYISRSLKALAKDLNVPVIALSQLSRAVETRTSKRPQLSDLRESGSIEQDADMVLFIYRPEYYHLDTFEDDTPSQGLAEIIFAKNRHGSLGDIRIRFQGQFTKFCDIESDSISAGIVPNSNFEVTVLESKMNDDSALPTDALPY